MLMALLSLVGKLLLGALAVVETMVMVGWIAGLAAGGLVLGMILLCAVALWIDRP